MNEKIDIQKVRFGTVLRICRALTITADELFDLCIVPEKCWHIYEENGTYFMQYHFGKTVYKKRLCKKNATNEKYIEKIARCHYELIIYGKDTFI